MSPAMYTDSDTPHRYPLLSSHTSQTTKEILLPAAVLPEQFYTKPGGKAVSQSIQALMHAILDDALWTWKKQFITKGRRTQRLANEAEAWFFSENDSWPFSFVNICEALGLDPTYIRQGIRQWRRHPPALASRANSRPVSGNRSCKLAA